MAVTLSGIYRMAIMENFFCKRATPFSSSEVLEILQNPPEKCVTSAPQKPSAGEAYCYEATSEGKEG